MPWQFTLSTCVYIYVHIYICVYIYLCVYIYVYIYINIYCLKIFWLSPCNCTFSEKSIFLAAVDVPVLLQVFEG